MDGFNFSISGIINGTGLMACLPVSDATLDFLYSFSSSSRFVFLSLRRPFLFLSVSFLFSRSFPLHQRTDVLCHWVSVRNTVHRNP